MGLFNKLANILFDEEVEEEIPVITKEENKKPVEKKEEEILITKVETKPHKVEIVETPKLIEETEVQTKKFSFPFIDDDLDEDMPKRSSGKTIEDYNYASTTSKIEIKPEQKKRSFLGLEEKKKEKSDVYTASRNNIYEPTVDEKKPFTLSPIISPVYGILNENYTKDDIIERNKSREERIDFDSVRRKAYGTLEDEIEVSLSRTETDILDEVPSKEDMTIDTLRDDGLSISDLLISDDEDDEKTGELFRVEELEDEEPIEDEVEIDGEDENTDYNHLEESTKDADETNNDEEDDLFDLIDSIYAGKDE